MTTVVPPVPRHGSLVTPKRSGGGPKPIVWLLLLASAAGVLLAGIFGTVLILGQLGGSIASLPAEFWGRLFVAAVLTIASLMLRSYINMTQQPLGFDADRLITFRTAIPPAYGDPTKIKDLVRPTARLLV